MQRRWSLFAVCLCLLAALAPQTVLAFPPGTSAGTCLAVNAFDAFIEDLTESTYPAFSGPIEELGELEPASFGPYVLIINGEDTNDVTIFVNEYDVNTGVTAPYAMQPVLFFGAGDQCVRIAMSDNGRGLCCGGTSIHFIEFDTVTQTFSFTSSVTSYGSNYAACYIHKDRAFVYDFASAAYDIWEWDGASWTQPIPATLSATSDAWAVSQIRDEIAIVALPNTLEFYYSAGPSYPLTLVNTLVVGTDPSYIQYDRDDNLVVSTSSVANSFLVYQRTAGVFVNPPTQSLAITGTAYNGGRISTSDSLTGPSYATVTFPSNSPTPTDGTVRRFRSPSAGAPYVQWDNYDEAWSGTGIISNSVARTPALPQLTYASDPFGDILNGRVRVFCNEELDCDGSCGPQCDLDNDLCTIDLYDPVYGCVFDSIANPDDGNPCTVDTCDPGAGFIYTPISGGACSAQIGPDTCPGVCVLGGCEPIDSTCGIVATASPTPSPSPSSGFTASATPTVSASQTASTTVSTTSTNTPTPTQTPSNTASNSATPTNTASTSATSSVSPSASPSPSASRSATPSATATIGCGFCAPFSVWECNRLVSCTPVSCNYISNDTYCESILTPPNDCLVPECTTSLSGSPTGCSLTPRPVDDPCDTGRPCLRNGRCTADNTCEGIPDDNQCMDNVNTQCATNRCQENLFDFFVDSQGCRLEAEPGPCIPDDPCVVHTAANPTFCDDVTFRCIGGEPVQCLEGAHCELGTCVRDECEGDDDDCYLEDDDEDDIVVTFEDDDDDDDDGGSGVDVEWLFLIPVVIIFAVACLCCIVYAIMVWQSDDNSRRRSQARRSAAIPLA